MQRRFLFTLATAAVCLFMHATAFSQSYPESYGLFCPSGLQPDGYIDFSGLPPAPTVNPDQPTAPVTATLPVHGIPGLSVTVTIAPLSSQTNTGYSVDGGTLFLGGVPSSSSDNTVLTLNFSQPISGLGLNTETTGRFDYSYALRVGLPSTEPPVFVSAANGYTLAGESPQTQPLQLVGLQTTFQTASIQFQGNEYYNIALSNLRVQSTAATAAVAQIPMHGLQQWLRADTGDIFGGTWQDQSGKGHDATPVNYPAFSADGRNCQAAWQFTGTQYFTFNLPIAGWNQMTVFLVAKATNDGPRGAYYSDNTAILWTEDAQWGNTFVSPYQTHASARFGTTQPGNNLAYTRPGGGVGQDFTITRAVHDRGTDSLFVNGVLASQQQGKLSTLGGVSGAGTIGQGINHTFFDGKIAEILVYDRVLTVNEAAQVELYLARKYGTE